MIYTLTLNPALDKMVTFSEISRTDVNRPLKVDYHAGGKGINVSIAASRLETENRAIFFSGGKNGEKIEKMLEKESVVCSVVRVEEESRENIKLYGEKSKEEIRVNEKGSKILKENLDKIKEILNNIEEDSYVVMSGTIPEGIENSFYFETAKKLKANKKAKIIIDADLEPMKIALEASPFMIKPNMEELERITGKPGNIREFIKIVEKYKIEYGFLTNGKKGAYLYNKEKLYFIKSPSVNAVTTLGAGDSFIGGFISSLSKKVELKECLKIAAATAAAKVEDRFNIDRIKELVREVYIEEIKITEEI